MIDGVRRRSLQPHADARGSLTELLRADWPEFQGFGQATLTLNLPGVIRAWHWHQRQTDLFIVIAGIMRIVLYDARSASPTYRELQEIVASGDDLCLVVVPPYVYHGYQTLSATPSLILNFPDKVYDPAHPDEPRIRSDSDEVPYRWRQAGS